MPTAPDRVAESRLLEIAGVPRGTWQSWSREGVVEPAADRGYDEQALVEVVLVNAVRQHFGLRETRRVWQDARRRGVVDDLVRQALDLPEDADWFDLVIEPAVGEIAVAADAAALGRVVRDPLRQRTVVVIPLAAELLRARRAFGRFAEPVVRRRGRGRSQAPEADVIPLRGRSNRSTSG